MKIKYLVMDVDGTLTDGKIYIGNKGEMMKAFSIKDGCGIHDLLIPSGIQPIIITGRKSKILLKRCKELGIKRIYQNVKDKKEILKSISEELNTFAYIGDDINDLPVMQLIKDAGGLIGCPSDAVLKVKTISNFVSEYKGGSGAVRDFIEFLLK